MIPHVHDFFVWAEWRLGHGRFKAYGPASSAHRPRLPYGGKGQLPLPQVWLDEYKKRFVRSSTSRASQEVGVIFSHNGLLVSDTNTKPGATWIVEHAKAANYTRVAVQTNGRNDAYIEEYHAAGSVHGVEIGIWDDVFTTSRTPGEHASLVDQWRAAFTIPNLEGSTDLGDWPAQFRALPGMGNISAAVIVTGDPALQKWIDNHFLVMTEAYLQESEHWSPAELDYHYKQNYPQLQVTVPCIGVYHNFAASNYLGKTVLQDGSPAPSTWAYLADGFQDADWLVRFP